jgi:hypothetical protein
MSEETPVTVTVDRIAEPAALRAYMMNDPHPKGYLWDSPAARVGRAVYAYEYFKANKKPTEGEPGWYDIPSVDEVRAVVLAKEQADE